MSTNFSELSLELTKNISKKEKKENGIFFTPLNIIKIMIEKLQDFSFNTILEPSCGSCEFIYYLDSIYNNKIITGIEINETIYNHIKNIKLNNNLLQLINKNYLDNDNNFYDLIIGNPPFYVINNKTKIIKEYKKYYDGRANIFILFIIHSLKKLNDNGILAFVLPKNFMNCNYYNKIRKFIYENYKIIDLIDCSNSNFIDTTQDTIIIIIQNNKNNNNEDFIIKQKDFIIYNNKTNIIKLKEFYNNSITLNDLNFEVKVGTIVWNENKDLLTSDNSKTRLIYSSDIKNGILFNTNYKNKEKKSYINKKGLIEPILVVNRGYGKGDYKFNYCIIDINEEYLIENHLIIIKYKNNINKEDLLELYEKIIKSFDNQKTKEFVKLYFNNNAINTTELQFILPIYIN